MSRRTAEHEAQLSMFFAGLAPAVEMATEAQKRLDLLAATKFSVFDYFDENENLIFGIFADLLRPDGSHGQGATFLRLFLKEVERGKEDCIRKARDYGLLDPCSVWTEYVTPGRRKIDIVLRIGDRWIGIENKPWAYDQPGQLQCYLNFLLKEDPRACILYLSGSGEVSGTIHEENAHYLTIPYGYANNGPSVAHWVAECQRHCQADNVRWFLKDLQKYIKRMFRAESSVEEHYDG